MPTIVHQWHSQPGATHHDCQLQPGTYHLENATPRTLVLVKLYPAAPQTDEDKELHARIVRDAEPDGGVWALVRTGPGEFSIPGRALVRIAIPAGGNLKITSEME